MKIYLSGPMSGYPEYNFPAFRAAAKRLRELGLEVIDPSEINQPDLNSWEQCMKNALRDMMLCDTIVMLPGWQNSKGAVIELELSEKLGYHSYELEEFIDRYQ